MELVCRYAKINKTNRIVIINYVNSYTVRLVAVEDTTNYTVVGVYFIRILDN